ncbi:MAG: cupin domain-containing protein [Arachnia sp.]
MPHLTDSDVRTFQLHGVTFSSYSSSATGATRIGAWRADFSPRTPGQAHTMSEEEVLYVLAGHLAVEVAEDSFVAEPGDAVLVPAGARFRVSNDTDQPAQAWVTTSIGMTAAMCAGGDRLAPPWAQ